MGKVRKFRPYKAYVFVGPDPIIQKVMEAHAKTGRTISETSEASGVSTTTLYNWRRKKVRRPQFCTVAATLVSCGTKIIRLDDI